MSGGMRQRVMIASALACEPELLIADEPTTALDVTIQRQILDLLFRVQRERDMATILISHDLNVVGGRTDSVAIMYAGRIAEIGPTPEIFAEPRHRYTEALFGSTPSIDHERHAPLVAIPGTLPDAQHLPAGCRFAPRCAARIGVCTTSPPALVSSGPGPNTHRFACYVPVEKTNRVARGVSAP
jgi:peptide/nickel transport system ATP-binding protein